MSRPIAGGYAEFTIPLFRNSLQPVFIGMTRLVDIPQ